MLLIAYLPHCALGFDATVPSFDVATEEDIAGQQDAGTSDVIPDSDARPDAGISDGGDTDDGPDDAAVDADAVVDADATLDPDGSSDAEADPDADADATPAPTVTVTAPTAGEYTVGETIRITWNASGAESAELALVGPDTCAAGEAGVVLPNLASVSAASGSWDWTIPQTLAASQYRVRVVVSSAVNEAFACSDVFTVVQPPGCITLGCGAQNRGCPESSGSAECGDCLVGYLDDGGTCAPVDCGSAPAAPSNATVALVTSTRFGGVVTYSCSAGHSTTGTPGTADTVTRRCGADGTWEALSGTCAPVDCGTNPAAAANARFTGVDRTTFGGTASYACNDGYRVTGESVSTYGVTCGADGVWSTGATCEAVDCGTLSNPANGSVSTPTGVEFNDVATYSCNTGFTRSSGSATRTCQVTGVWSGSAAVCSPVDCGAPPTVTNGSRTFTSTTFSSTASYSCNSGYTRSGSGTLTCSAAGSWGTPPTCGDTNECTSGSVCTATGNICTNTIGSWQCSCASGYSGTTVTGGNASCSLTPSLGATCSSDSQCPSNSWCSTVSGYRRCSPRAFSGAAHQMDFVFVPLTSPPVQQGTPGATNNERPYTATISRNYFVSRTEVTQGQWKAATGGTNPSYFQNTSCVFGSCSSIDNANNSGPVERVDWFSTLAYANWLSTNQGLSPCYTLTPSTCADSVSDWADGDTDCTGATFTEPTCTGYRLLTESEWERAARGGTTSTYYWGEATDTATVGLYAWFDGNAGSRTQAVGGKQANAYGLFDMSGNVWEWVWDWVYGGSGWVNYPSGSATDYIGPASGSGRGIRGGSWYFDASYLRSADRNFDTPDDRGSGVGFRLARTAN